MAQKVYSGTEIKLNIHIDPIGKNTMDDYDFTVEVFAAKSVTIPKGKAIRVDKDNYIVIADTGMMGVGRIRCKVTAHIPDEDIEDGYRTEVTVKSTDIDIIKL